MKTPFIIKMMISALKPTNLMMRNTAMNHHSTDCSLTASKHPSRDRKCRGHASPKIST